MSRLLETDLLHPVRKLGPEIARGSEKENGEVRNFFSHLMTSSPKKAQICFIQHALRAAPSGGSACGGGGSPAASAPCAILAGGRRAAWPAGSAGVKKFFSKTIRGKL